MLSKPDFKYKNVVLVLTREKEKLSIKNDNLIVKNSDNNIILQKSCYRIFALWIVGPFILTSGLIEKAKKFGFQILFFSFSFKYINGLNIKTEGNVLLRKIQYDYNSIEIGKHLITNKVKNQQSLLKSIRKKNITLKDNIESLSNIIYSKIPICKESNSLMGIEGVASRVFFDEWFKNNNWKGRKPRAKIDITNVLMDIGYTLLFNYVDAMLNLYGFDLYNGVYHKFFYQRKSLACDLVEPFRCIIDKQIKKSYNLSQIDNKDFKFNKNKVFLPYKNSKKYFKILIESILENKDEIFKYFQLYYRSFINQKPINEYPTFKIN